MRFLRRVCIFQRLFKERTRLDSLQWHSQRPNILVMCAFATKMSKVATFCTKVTHNKGKSVTFLTVTYPFYKAHNDHHAAGHVGGTGYLTSAAGEVARDVAHGAVRSNDLNVNDPVQGIVGLALDRASSMAFLPAETKATSLSPPDGFTVIDDNANVVDRVTGNIACIQSVTDTFFLQPG